MALNLSQEAKDIAKTCYNKIASFSQEHSGQQLHQMIKEQCSILVKLMPEDLAANKSMLASLVKTKQFDAALAFINQMPQTIKGEFSFEHAYVLHRLGNN